MAFVRCLELLFAAYCLIHIPTTVVFDSAIVLPRNLYPKPVSDLMDFYVTLYKDTLFASPPVWYKTFVYVELALQLPFFFIAVYAFAKGSCSWIRTPVVIYSSWTMATVTAIVGTVLFDDMSRLNLKGPETQAERWQLAAIYLPFFVVPFLMLVTVVASSRYSPKALQQQQQRGVQKKKHRD